MISSSDIGRITGSTVLDDGGDKIGTAGEVYLDDTTGQPEWVTVNTGLFGTSESFVPLAQAQLSDSGLRVPYDKKMVKDAPRLGEAGHLTPQEEDELYRYYGLSAQGGAGQDTTSAGYVGNRETVGHDTSGPSTDDAMTRSEERLKVGTERREAGRARLRKYVTTRTETVNVPVSHEEVRLVREPITDANMGDAMDGPAISEEEHEVVLHEERPVVNVEAVPVERVRVDVATVTETQAVTGQVRKEHIEADVDGDGDVDTVFDGDSTTDRR